MNGHGFVYKCMQHKADFRSEKKGGEYSTKHD